MKEITSEYNPSDRKISFVIQNNGYEFAYNGIRFFGSLNYEDLVVGKEVVVETIIMKTKEGNVTHRANGTRIVKIAESL